MNYGNLFIIIAPSGVGKSSLIKALTNLHKDISVSISYTTRKPRPTEKNGFDYHFIEIDEFQKMHNDKVFLESANVHGNFYGTSKDFINHQISKGKDIIVEIDWQGAKQIKLQYPEATSIFILPPSIEEMRKRLIKRAQDDLITITRRINAATTEIKYAKTCEYIIVNNDFDKALSDLIHIINATKLKFQVQASKNVELFTRLGVTTE
ncbi:guanylate kinase [Candidatus Kinetoplastidibacterium crithidiae]|uniref:Guanylate kinase n=1 Tax=Candidatus Kinetoplastidibacterium crithidiae TCC036E TaxID=1208918 RepID=M1LWG3_9PROT|nr:guanylate kinase [Candidatus Kinetoplastibacterium crithidii]AFZ82779.1 guanylate kinase [Candidatus Kinetoplastibacterium crithidii (ex Angomonas deanei ATCC 30255)]AGF47569.1 guanylate kinase [Candidatus Kinetoplastibacterium crithidii TCC036E]EPY41010.1 guanylate kinase [Angomonas deanei]EPY41495.1 guanylate kinase [Angomonas deanei]|eukprot:EPY41010.1 guanylate kinase [Angomonas deanei]